MTNQHPEKQFFDRAKALEEEIRERREDLKALFEEIRRHNKPLVADDDPNVIDIGTMRGAIKRSLETDKQAKKRRDKEADIEEMLDRLGHLAGTPLGQSAAARIA